MLHTGADVEQLWSIAGENAKGYTRLCKTVQQLLIKLNKHSPYNSKISPPVIYPGELYTDALVNTCMCKITPDLLAVFSVVNWKQPKCPFICEW